MLERGARFRDDHIHSKDGGSASLCHMRAFSSICFCSNSFSSRSRSRRFCALARFFSCSLLRRCGRYDRNARKTNENYRNPNTAFGLFLGETLSDFIRGKIECSKKHETTEKRNKYSPFFGLRGNAKMNVVWAAIGKHHTPSPLKQWPIIFINGNEVLMEMILNESLMVMHWL